MVLLPLFEISCNIVSGNKLLSDYQLLLQLKVRCDRKLWGMFYYRVRKWSINCTERDCPKLERGGLERGVRILVGPLSKQKCLN